MLRSPRIGQNAVMMKKIVDKLSNLSIEKVKIITTAFKEKKDQKDKLIEMKRLKRENRKNKPLK